MSGALKEILDSLNERPLQKKAISARPFLTVLEKIFRQRISRSQQDAQEFLQVVAEKLAEEYHGIKKMRKRRESRGSLGERLASPTRDLEKEARLHALVEAVEERGMPLEGAMESEIICTQCKYRKKPICSKFVVLTVSVPHKVGNLAACSQYGD